MEEVVLDEQERYMNELDEAAAKYNLVIDINSLCHFSNGWGLYGKSINDYVGPEKKGTVEGRVIALIGEYKTGKTWLSRMLLRNDLADSQSIHTPGICMSYVEEKPEEGGNPQAKPATPSRGAGGRRGRGGMVASPARRAPTNHPDVPRHDYVVLDTAGTDAACNYRILKDVRATEIFLRKALVEIADKHIYVTSKFNKNTQIAIDAVIQQLSHKPNGNKSSNDRLIVVHNMWQVDDEQVLKRYILELEAVYQEPEGETEQEFEEHLKQANRYGMAHDRNVKPWDEVTETVEIEGKKQVFTYYKSRLTTHVLLVKHGRKDDEKEAWRYYHNMAGFHVLRAIVRFNLDARKINLLDEVMKIAGSDLHKYIKGFDQTPLDIKTFAGIPYIYPRTMPVDESEDEEGEEGGVADVAPAVESGGEKEQEGESEVVEEEQGEATYRPAYQLKDMEFTDNDIIPEGDRHLQASVFDSKSSYIIKIIMPGVSSKDKVYVHTWNFENLRVSVDLPPPFSEFETKQEEIVCLSSDVQWGRGFFNWAAPSGKRFFNLKKEEKDKATTLKDGVFTLILTKPSEDVDEDQETEEPDETPVDEEGQ